MKKAWLTVVGAFALTASLQAYNGKLKCDNINETLAQLNDGRLRAFCEWAERTCQAEKFLKKTPEAHSLKQDLEPKLRHDLGYNLELCELAIMHWDKNYYNQYLKR